MVVIKIYIMNDVSMVLLVPSHYIHRWLATACHYVITQNFKQQKI